MAVFEEVADVIIKTLKGVQRDQLRAETRFEEDLGADSLDLVEIIMELEEHYDVTIPDEDAQGISTVGDAVNYIEARTKK